MALYAVGDIQGCYNSLAFLLDKVNFDTNKDKLVCVGDLVNRGPDSLKVLRLLKSLKKQCVSVLGNHDISLLAMYHEVREPRPSDTINQVLEAHDVDELCDWLRKKPLIQINDDYHFAAVHAGIYPWWSLDEAVSYADEIHPKLISHKKCKKMLAKAYGNKPSRWDPDLQKTQRQRFIINAFTRMRFCSPKQHLNLNESGYKGRIRKNRLPWFQFNNPGLGNYRIIFGHWSALGLLNNEQFLALDTGCVWGGPMTLAKVYKKRKKPIDIFQTLRK